MASADAKPVPAKNAASRVTFPIFDADGDLVSAAAALDSEVSLDGGTFADATNEATEIATGSGMYFLDLTAAEMNADTVAIIVKTTTTGAKTTPIVIYPEETGDINVDVTAFGGTAGTFAAGRPEVNASHIGGTLQTAGDIIADTNDIQARLPAALVAGLMNSSVGAVATGAITAGGFAAGAINAAALAADAAQEIVDEFSIRRGTAQAGAATSITLDGGASATTDIYNGLLIEVLSGTGAGQARLVTAYNGTTKVAITAPSWITNPDSTSVFRLMPWARVDLHLWSGSAANALIAGRVDANAQVVGDKTGYSVSAVSAGAITTASFAAGAIDSAALATSAADEIVNAMWDELTSEGRVVGSYGQLFKDNVNATISSRSSHSAADVWTSATRTLTAFGFSVTVGTNNDKTGYSLSTLESAVLHSGTAQAGAAGTITLTAGASATNDLYVGQTIKLYGGTGLGQTRTITAYAGTSKVATVDRNWITNPDVTTTYAVESADNPDLDSALQIARVTLVDTLTTYTGNTVQTGDSFARLGAPAGASVSADILVIDDYVDTEIAAIKAKTDGLNFTGTKVNAIVLRWLTDDAAGTPNVLITGKVDASATASISSADKDDIVDRVWDEAIAGHLTAGTTGLKLNSAASAGDPWSTSLPGSYASGTGGNIVGNLERRGAGSVHYELVVKDSAGNPIDGCEVYVTSDSAGNNVVAGTLTTDAFGKATFQLDVGTFYAFRKKSGFTFTNPKMFTVT